MLIAFLYVKKKFRERIDFLFLVKLLGHVAVDNTRA